MGRKRPIVVDVSAGATRNSFLFVRWGISLQLTGLSLIIGCNFLIKYAISVELMDAHNGIVLARSFCTRISRGAEMLKQVSLW